MKIVVMFLIGSVMFAARDANATQLDDPKEAVTLLENAADFHKKGEESLAISAANRALELRRVALGNEHPKTAEALVYAGKYQLAAGEEVIAIELTLESVRIYEKLGSAFHNDLAKAYYRLAMMASGRSEYVTSVAYLRKMLAIEEKVFGTESSEVANTAKTLALSLAMIGKLSEASNQLQRTFDIRLKVYGPRSPEIVDVLEDLCTISMRQNFYETAKQYGVKALEVQGKLEGVENPRTAHIIVTLGTIASRENDFALAKETLKQGEDIYRRILKPNDSRIANVLMHRAQVYRLENEFETARDLFGQAVKIHETLYGEDQSTTAECLYGVAETSFMLQDYPSAVAACDRARRITKNYMARNLPYLPEEDQLDFIEGEDTYRFDEILSAARMLASDATVNEVSASWVLNSQGVAQESMTERNRRLLKAASVEEKQSLNKLSNLRQQLAHQSISGDSAKDNMTLVDEVKTLTDQTNELTKQLALKFGSVDDTDRWVELDSVRRAMEPDSIILQFARFNEFDFSKGAASGVYRYLVWVIPPRGNVTLVDLGKAEPIDRIIGEVRQMIANAAKIDGTLKKTGEEAATKELRIQLAKLRQLTFTPIAAYVEKAKKLWICPDGSLWLSPWAALPTGKGDEFLIEKVEIQFLVTPRNLAEKKADVVSNEPPVIFANPRFDLAPTSVWKSISELSQQLGQESPTEKERLRSFKRASIRPFANVLPLPNTAIEAEFISPSLKRLTGSPPILYLDQYALEYVAHEVRHPRVLVFGTHGFLMLDEQAKSSDNGNKSEVDIRNPLTRCGLLLAGCKDPNAGQATAGDDGVLTGMEIVGMDLHGTQLVILSACETGVGKVRNGEGVASLCQAFQLAGAESVVATLWAVSDRDSVLLVGKFVEELANGKSKAAAMREAQMERIEKRRQRYGDAHPFFWSAFTVTGK